MGGSGDASGAGGSAGHADNWCGDVSHEARPDAAGQTVTRAVWLSAACGTSNEIVLEYDEETREWVNRHFPSDPHEPVS